MYWAGELSWYDMYIIYTLYISSNLCLFPLTNFSLYAFHISADEFIWSHGNSSYFRQFLESTKIRYSIALCAQRTSLRTNLLCWFCEWKLHARNLISQHTDRCRNIFCYAKKKKHECKFHINSRFSMIIMMAYLECVWAMIIIMALQPNIYIHI